MVCRCVAFAAGCGKAFFILQPQYVHRKAYYSGVLTYAVRMLTYAERMTECMTERMLKVCRRLNGLRIKVLTYAHVCSRMLTYARMLNVCRRLNGLRIKLGQMLEEKVEAEEEAERVQRRLAAALEAVEREQVTYADVC